MFGLIKSAIKYSLFTVGILWMGTAITFNGYTLSESVYFATANDEPTLENIKYWVTEKYETFIDSIKSAQAGYQAIDKSESDQLSINQSSIFKAARTEPRVDLEAFARQKTDRSWAKHTHIKPIDKVNMRDQKELNFIIQSAK